MQVFVNQKKGTLSCSSAYTFLLLCSLTYSHWQRSVFQYGAFEKGKNDNAFIPPASNDDTFMAAGYDDSFMAAGYDDSFMAAGYDDTSTMAASTDMTNNHDDTLLATSSNTNNDGDTEDDPEDSTFTTTTTKENASSTSDVLMNSAQHGVATRLVCLSALS
jgi:hypothetical protein